MSLWLRWICLLYTSLGMSAGNVQRLPAHNERFKRKVHCLGPCVEFKRVLIPAEIVNLEGIGARAAAVKPLFMALIDAADIMVSVRLVVDFAVIGQPVRE